MLEEQPTKLSFSLRARLDRSVKNSVKFLDPEKKFPMGSLRLEVGSKDGLKPIEKAVGGLTLLSEDEFKKFQSDHAAFLTKTGEMAISAWSPEANHKGGVLVETMRIVKGEDPKFQLQWFKVYGSN